MKRILTLAAALAASFILSASLHAQADLPYLSPGESFSVTLVGQPSLYSLTEEEEARLQEKAAFRSYDDAVMAIKGRKHVKGPRGGTLDAVGFARSQAAFGYDLYVVVWNGRHFLLHPDGVHDNAVLAGKNECMVDEYNELVADYDGAAAMWKVKATVKAGEVEAELRKVGRDESRIDAIIDSLTAVRLAAEKDPSNETVDRIRTAASEEVRDRIRERRATWTARKDYLVNPGKVTDRTAGYFSDEIALYEKVERLRREIAAYEERNHLR